MQKLSEQNIAEMKAQHAELQEVTAAGVTVYIRPPTRMEFQRWREASLDEKRRNKALDGLFFSCVVWPERKDLDDLLEKRPGLILTIGNECLSLAGVTQDVEKKDL